MSKEEFDTMMQELLVIQDERNRKRAKEPFFRLVMSEATYDLIKANPKLFMDAYREGVTNFCEENGLI